MGWPSSSPSARGMRGTRALHDRDGRHMSAFCRRLPGYIWWWPAALGLLVPACALPDTATSRSIDTVIAERRAALIDSLKSGGWLVQADMENASLVGMSRARSLRRKPFTNADLRTINYDGGPLLTGHDLLAVFADLIAGASGAGPLNYMEIGVAQGRNIFGALQVFGPTWHATAFSFERINPPLEAKLRASSAASGARIDILKEWTASDRAPYRTFLRRYREEHESVFKTSNGRVERAHPTGLAEEDPEANPGFFPYAVTQYSGLRTPHSDAKSFTYLHGDAYDANAWAALANLRAQKAVGPWQLVLSDAEHTDATVQYECDQYASSKIINWTEPFAVVWDDEMMNTYCTHMLQRLSPRRLVFGSVKVMGRVSVHTWQFAASLPRGASHMLAEQLRAMRVPHHLVHPNGQASHCCGKEKKLAPPKPPPTA